MRLDGGTSLCHILIEQPSILDFALYDHINGHSNILRLGLGLSTTTARRKRRTLPSCRPSFVINRHPFGMSSPVSPPSRAAADPLLEPGRADARVGVLFQV